MKSIQILVVLMITLFSFTSFAQSYETEEMDSEMIDQMLAVEGEETEFVPPVSEDIERQEDILYPEGEETDWSLGSEDLPAEEFE